jgi:spore coat polysaccharide biosynthesis protein SpsF (cytidylyltransferase family)
MKCFHKKLDWEELREKNRVLNIDIFIPVRLDSKRLPKKHFLKINGIPIIKILIDRLQNSNKIRHIIVCTTNEKSDDPLVDYLKKIGIKYYRGNNTDILERMLNAAKKFDTDIIIDVEGDKIFTDSIFVDKIVDEMINSDLDFIIGSDSSNSFNPANHLVHGFIPAGFKTSVLENIVKLKNTANTETGYKEFFLLSTHIKKKFLVLKMGKAISKKVRLTIDYNEDYILAKKIFKELSIFSNYKDIIKLLEKTPDLLKITMNSIKEWENNYQKNIGDFSLKNK